MMIMRTMRGAPPWEQIGQDGKMQEEIVREQEVERVAPGSRHGGAVARAWLPQRIQTQW